jgi:hypothetical protein
MSASGLLRIALEIEEIHPLLSYDLNKAATRLAANPGLQTWEEHLDNLIVVLKSLDQELEQAMENLGGAEEFARFFAERFVEEDELEDILRRSEQLGKVATSQIAGFRDFFKSMLNKIKGDQEEEEEVGVEPSYVLDENAMSDFVEGKADWAEASHYIEEEFKENKNFFTKARSILKEMEDIRRKPDRSNVERLRQTIKKLIKHGENMLHGVRKYLIKPAKPIVEIEDKGIEKEKITKDSSPVLTMRGLDKTVEHYLDMLKESAGDKDKTIKYLKEFFREVKPAIEEEKAAIAAKKEARRTVLSMLTRFAYNNPNTRSILLPIIREELNY